MNGLLKKPPRGAVLQAGHPLARGLQCSCILNEGSGSAVWDGNNRVLCPQGGSSPPTWRDGGYWFDGSGDWFSLPTKPFWVGSGPYSMAFGASLESTAPTYSAVLSWNNYAPAVYFMNGVVILYGGGVSLSSKNWKGAGYHNHCLTSEGKDGTFNGYADGAFYESDTDTKLKPAATTMRLGNSGITTENFKGLMTYFHFWNRVLSPAEILALNLDPYCMFRPVAYDLRVLAALDSGGAIQAAALDGLSLGETLQPRGVYGASCADGMAAGETMGKAAVFRVSAQGGFSLGSAVASTAILAGLAQDGAGFAGVPLPALHRIAQAMDGVTLAESLAVTAFLGAASQDGLSLSDLASKAWSTPGQAVDAARIAGQAQARLTALATAQDGAILGDTIQTAAHLLAAIAEGFRAGDDASFDGTGLFSALAVDGLSLGGSVLARLTALGNALDGITLQASPGAVAHFVVEARDAAELGEAVAALARLSAIAGDGLGLGDAAMHPSPSGGSIYITFTGLTPGMAATAHRPGIVFEIKMPGITFTKQ